MPLFIGISVASRVQSICDFDFCISVLFQLLLDKLCLRSTRNTNFFSLICLHFVHQMFLQKSMAHAFNQLLIEWQVFVVVPPAMSLIFDLRAFPPCDQISKGHLTVTRRQAWWGPTVGLARRARRRSWPSNCLPRPGTLIIRSTRIR